MLRIVILILALFIVMPLNNFAHAQITTSVVATPTEKTCAIGNENGFNVTGSCMANGLQLQESIQNCQWKYVSVTAYSDETCTTIDSTIVSATTTADTEWANTKSYAKDVKIKGLKAGTSWVKFRMKYRLNGTDNGTEITSITPVKIIVKNITLTAPRWLQKGAEGTIEITYDTTAFTEGTIELNGLSDLYEIIDSDSAGITNNATSTPPNVTLSWNIANRTGDKSGKIVVKIKGKNPKESKLIAKHSKSDAKAETDVGVFYVDIILGGVAEDKEESPGVFFAEQKRASLELKAEPKSAGETVTLSLTGLDLYDGETSDTKNTKRTWNLATENLPTGLYVGGKVSSSMRDKEAKLTWKSKNDTAKVTAVSVQVKIGKTEEEKNDKKAFVRYYAGYSIGDMPDKGKTIIEFKYYPSDLDYGTLKPTVGDKVQLFEGSAEFTINNNNNNNTKWTLPLTNATKSLTCTAQSFADNDIKVSLEHDETDAQDEGLISVYQLDLAKNTKVFDPKLSNTAKIETILKYPDSITSDIAVYDGGTIVKTLTKTNPNWDGKWDNGTNANKIADPKKYTIKTKLYKDIAKTKEIDSDEADVYTVRLGIEKIEFASHGGGIYVPMQFHTTRADVNSGLSTAATKWKYDAAWQLSNEGTTLNIDKSDGSEAIVESTIYTETFYPKMTTAATPTRSTYYNYPICYVKNSKIKIKPTMSDNYVSHITSNPATGTLPTGTPDIFLKVKKKTSTGYGTEKQSTNKITSGTTVELDLDDTVKNSVGNETIEFEYNWFYKDGTKGIQIPGNFKSTHKCYAIVDTPHKPWGITTGEIPWLAVVDIATSNKMAEGVTCTTADLKPLYIKMEKAINELSGSIGGKPSSLKYDTNRGGMNYTKFTNRLAINTPVEFRLANFMLFLKNDYEFNKVRLFTFISSSTPHYRTPNIVNCLDCASIFTSFTNILGGNLCIVIIDKGYVLNPINPIGTDQFSSIGFWDLGVFSYHAVSVHNSTGTTTPSSNAPVYDACLKVGIPDPTKNVNGINATNANCKLSAGLPFDIPNNLSIGSIAGNEVGKLNCNPTSGANSEIDGINAHYEIVVNPDTTTYLLKKDDQTAVNNQAIATGISQDGINIAFTIGTVTSGKTFSFDTIYNYNEYKSSLSAPGTNGRGKCNWLYQVQTFNID
ncbi:MAG: hypothetical protein LBT09_06120 [Planctomycetaceae bacterium]|jgi:hypothetical protein|nr:hypothetical protein [Planctomycetaceae bacterium]